VSDVLERALNDLVIANRILHKEDIVDAYGHVSIRHPELPNHYFLSRSLAPNLVTRDDIIEFDLESNIVGGDSRAPYLERFIHGAIYEMRPEIMSVVHAHAEDTLPFGIVRASATPLRPVIHSAAFLGAHIPIWDIRDDFGDTNLLVSNLEQGRSLAKQLGAGSIALMSAHGFAACGRSISECTRIAIVVAKNARVLLKARALGTDLRYLTDGEIARHGGTAHDPYSSDAWRAWEYWAKAAGVDHLLWKPE
jgi:ribulose-5-phosphate 4-epimerase/fuculose-1-phosphate aldolase